MADFPATVVLFDHLQVLVGTRWRIDERLGALDREGPRHVVIQGGVVLFQREHIVGPLSDDLAGDGGLAAHRVDGDRGPREVQHAQQGGDGGALVGLLRHRDLAEDEPTVAGPGAHHMEGALPRPPMSMRPAQRLAVERHDLARRTWHRRPHPGQETGLQRLGIERGEDAPEGVMAGDAAGQRQEGSQPGLLRLGKRDHAHEAVRPANHRTQRNRQDVQQLMPPRPRHAGVRQRREMCRNPR